MKKRLNNALNELDERLIQEAAQADRLESSAPKIMRRILIPTGAVAAAGLCAFGLSNLPRGGVDLVVPSPASSIAAVLSESEDMTTEVNESKEAESEEMPDMTVTHDRAEYDQNEVLIGDGIRLYQSHNGITVDHEEVLAKISRMIYPLDCDNTVITTYNGYDEWRGGTHYGIDISAEGINGEGVLSPLPGTVIETSGSDDWNNGFGNYIIIDHGSGLSTVYAHLGEVHVSAGQSVEQGCVIGTVGSTGWSTGPHLHFEIREDGEVTSEIMDHFIARPVYQSVTMSFEDPIGSFGFAGYGTDDLSKFTTGTFTVDGNTIICVFDDGNLTYSFTTNDENLLKKDVIRGLGKR